MDVEILAITALQKEKRGKRLKIQLQLWTLSENGAYVLSTEMKQTHKFTWSRQRVGSHTQRGKKKAATMLKNRKETELISENHRKKVDFSCILRLRKHEQEWFW